MADLRSLERNPALGPRARRARRPWRPLSDTQGGATLEYALLIFVISTMIGFVLPHFGLSLMALFDHLTAIIEAVTASLRG